MCDFRVQLGPRWRRQQPICSAASVRGLVLGRNEHGEPGRTEERDVAQVEDQQRYSASEIAWGFGGRWTPGNPSILRDFRR
jgi:hypothetical protein